MNCTIIKNIHYPFIVAVLLATLVYITGCSKVNVQFQESFLNEDPDIVFLETTDIAIGTHRTDSFITSGGNVLAAGYHYDPESGSINASAYIQFSIPSTNTIASQNIIYDSATLELPLKSSYYGDTTLPVYFTIKELAEKMVDKDGNNTSFYNTTKYATGTRILGNKQIILRPNKDTILSIKLNDELGKDLFDKLKNQDQAIATETNFINYLNGIKIETDTTNTNVISYFMQDDAHPIALRVHFRKINTQLEESYIDFTMNTVTHFSNITGGIKNNNLGNFTNARNPYLESAATGNKAFLNPMLGYRPRIAFNNIFSLVNSPAGQKIKLLKAILIVRPYRPTTDAYYTFPDSVRLQVTNEYYDALGLLVDNNGTAQNGNLVIDNLNKANTHYQFDVTSFLTAYIQEGKFSTDALFIESVSGYISGDKNRLIITDNKNAQPGIQLQLYTLIY